MRATSGLQEDVLAFVGTPAQVVAALRQASIDVGQQSRWWQEVRPCGSLDECSGVPEFSRQLLHDDDGSRLSREVDSIGGRGCGPRGPLNSFDRPEEGGAERASRCNCPGGNGQDDRNEQSCTAKGGRGRQLARQSRCGDGPQVFQLCEEGEDQACEDTKSLTTIDQGKEQQTRWQQGGKPPKASAKTEVQEGQEAQFKPFTEAQCQRAQELSSWWQEEQQGTQRPLTRWRPIQEEPCCSRQRKITEFFTKRSALPETGNGPRPEVGAAEDTEQVPEAPKSARLEPSSWLVPGYERLVEPGSWTGPEAQVCSKGETGTPAGADHRPVVPPERPRPPTAELLAPSLPRAYQDEPTDLPGLELDAMRQTAAPATVAEPNGSGKCEGQSIGKDEGQKSSCCDQQHTRPPTTTRGVAPPERRKRMPKQGQGPPKGRVQAEQRGQKCTQRCGKELLGQVPTGCQGQAPTECQAQDRPEVGCTESTGHDGPRPGPTPERQEQEHQKPLACWAPGCTEAPGVCPTLGASTPCEGEGGGAPCGGETRKHLTGLWPPIEAPGKMQVAAKLDDSCHHSGMLQFVDPGGPSCSHNLSTGLVPDETQCLKVHSRPQVGRCANARGLTHGRPPDLSHVTTTACNDRKDVKQCQAATA